MSEDLKKITVKGMTLKDELNPDLFQYGKLNSSVETKVNTIVDKFIQSSKYNPENYETILFGEFVSYFWTKDNNFYIGIVFDYSKLGDNLEMIESYFIQKCFNFNKKSELKIESMKVKIKTFDSKANLLYESVYSVVKKNWVKKPSQEPKDFERSDVLEKIADISHSIELLDSIKTEDKKRKALQVISSKISSYHRAYENKNFNSEEYIVFNSLKSSGHLQKFYQTLKELNQ